MGRTEDGFDSGESKHEHSTVFARALIGVASISGFLALMLLRGANAQGLAASPTAVDAPQLSELPADVAAKARSAHISIQDALLRPFSFEFRKPTPLDEVARRLAASLGSKVVLDRAALQRSGVKGTSNVELELDGVRLATGLRLLLDQVELTYRIVPEDDLLVITDRLGSDDPIDRIASDLSALHEEVHALQASVNEILDILDPLPAEGDAEVRKPTLEDGEPAAPAPKPKGRDAIPREKARPGL
jgi:hypothetical protein